MSHELRILKNIQRKLPSEITNIIYEYIPNKIKYRLTKESYTNNHEKITKEVPVEKLELYFRMIVRRDLDFVFNIILHENIINWIFYITNYVYNDDSYKNYLYFMYFYALENDAYKCKQICETFFEKSGFNRKKNTNKNKHKNKIIRSIIWRA